MVRMWDTATGRLIGPPIRHLSPVHGVAFSPDGKSFLTRSEDGRTRLFLRASEVPDDLDRAANSVEVFTGLTLDPQQGSIQVLDNAAWRERRDHLNQLGTPALAENKPKLDPVSFAIDPTARGRALMERGWSDEAEAAFDKVVRERPYDASSWLARSVLRKPWAACQSPCGLCLSDRSRP